MVASFLKHPVCIPQYKMNKNLNEFSNYCKPTFVHGDFISLFPCDKNTMVANNFSSKSNLKPKLIINYEYQRTFSQWKLFATMKVLANLAKCFSHGNKSWFIAFTIKFALMHLELKYITSCRVDVRLLSSCFKQSIGTGLAQLCIGHVIMNSFSPNLSPDRLLSMQSSHKLWLHILSFRTA